MEHCLVVVVASASDPSWMYLVISFLADRSLLTDIKEVEKVWRTSSRFWLSEDKKLYQQSFRGLYLLCLQPTDISGFPTELHEGVYGGHSGGRSLSHRVIT